MSRVLHLTTDEITAICRHRGSLPLAVTPYYASLLDPDDPSQPLRRTVVPVSDEYLRTPGEAEDPLGEDDDSPVPGLVHRYPDRVLFLVTDFCVDQLPLLHAVAHGRDPERRHARPDQASGSGPRLHRGATPRSATCCCRAATP